MPATDWIQRSDGTWIMHAGAFSALIYREPKLAGVKERFWKVLLTFGGSTEKTNVLAGGRETDSIESMKAEARLTLKRWIERMLEYAPNALKLLSE